MTPNDGEIDLNMCKITNFMSISCIYDLDIDLKYAI